MEVDGTLCCLHGLADIRMNTILSSLNHKNINVKKERWSSRVGDFTEILKFNKAMVDKTWDQHQNKK
jgi:hypothetical protein